MYDLPKIDLTEDGRVSVTPYVLDHSVEMPMSQKRPAVVVIPGGGYNALSDREGEPVAMAFAAQGFHTFVLRYSVGEYASFPQPLTDLMKCMKLIKERADEWHVDTGSIAVCGFSAGGHLAASLGVYWNDPVILDQAGVTAEEARPGALVLCYPVITAGSDREPTTIRTAAKGHEDDPDILDVLSLEKHAGPHTPPTFLAHTYYDPVVPVENSLLFAKALADADVAFELHVTQDGNHGLALGNHITSYSTTLECSKFGAWVKNSGDWMRKLFGYLSSGDTPYPPAYGRKRRG